MYSLVITIVVLIECPEKWTLPVVKMPLYLLAHYAYRVDDNLLVKIADFGLSRDVYESNYYVLRHSAKLPVRWMALESILDGRFNLKTDVVCVRYHIMGNV